MDSKNPKKSFSEQSREAYKHESIIANFDKDNHTSHIPFSIQDGSVIYGNQTIIHDINLFIQPGDRVALQGKNGSGKTTIFKAIINNGVHKMGMWHFPSIKDIVYLDQQYTILNQAGTPFELIKKAQPTWSDLKIDTLLNNFLFRRKEEINSLITQLSNGEKTRLELAYAAAKSPILLLVDEIMNAVDSTTDDHIIEVLNQYPGTLIIASNDHDFLRAININRIFKIVDTLLVESDII